MNNLATTTAKPTANAVKRNRFLANLRNLETAEAAKGQHDRAAIIAAISLLMDSKMAFDVMQAAKDA